MRTEHRYFVTDSGDLVEPPIVRKAVAGSYKRRDRSIRRSIAAVFTWVVRRKQQAETQRQAAK